MFEFVDGLEWKHKNVESQIFFSSLRISHQPRHIDTDRTMAAPPQLHIPPPISEEDFECGRLKPLSHSPEAISDALIKYISPGRCHDWSKFSVRQRRAITKFQGQGTWNLGDPDNIDDIKKYFEIFDDAFFGGLLKGFCKLELIATPWIIRREGRSSEGLCRRYFPGKERDPRYKLEKPYVVITLEDEIYDQRSMRLYKPTQRIQIYLAALLHEMSHAIFDIYCCQCNKGCRQKTMREATPGGPPFVATGSSSYRSCGPGNTKSHILPPWLVARSWSRSWSGGRFATWISDARRQSSEVSRI